jgi:nitrite reductase/ring-hydroxylating ferredoxin subunit
MDAVAEQNLTQHGVWMRRRRETVPGIAELHERIRSEIISGVTKIAGKEAGDKIRSQGLEMLHTVIASGDIGRLRDHVLDTLRNDLLKATVNVGRSALGWKGEFYVDDYLILRINFPYEVARKADPAAENPGIGRVSPSVREIAKARRTTDPVYDPKGYHRGHPPAAWAHGPHIDSWAGHSRDGINIWWAMCEVPAEASMVLYPELADKTLPCDRRTLYLKAGYPLPKPTYLPLAAGEMLIFDPEILHGTHLNVTDKTRVAVSTRLNAHKPVFDPACFYARELWRRASAIEGGNFDEVLHLKREENLVDVGPVPEVVYPPRAKVVEVAAKNGGPVTLGPSSLVPEGGRIVAQLPEQRVVVLRDEGKLYGVDASCPHYGLDLTDGASDKGKLYCPACGISFDLKSGRSGCASLSLKLVDVREESGKIVLNPAGS